MQPKSDAQLLRDYAQHGANAEPAFTELVHRHTSLIYSAALRQLESPDLAADITQRVFLSLVHRAAELAPRFAENDSLAGWLCRSARNLSLNHRRDQSRRRHRETQAMQHLNLAPEPDPDWELLRPVLDEAMSELTESDYDTLVLRYYKNHDLRSLGQFLGVSDDTAQKRVSRALEKLRQHLSRRGINRTAAALTVAISVNAVQAAPAGLAATISVAAALAGSAPSAPAIITATKAIAMTTLQRTLVTVALAATIGTGLYQTHQTSVLRRQLENLREQQSPLAEQLRALQQDRDNATNQLASLREENQTLQSNLAQLPKLRGDLTRLRSAAAANSPAATDPVFANFKELQNRIAKLKQRVAQNPEAKIPEFRFLTDDDYYNAARFRPMDNEEAYLAAMSNLRSSAEFAFIAHQINPALTQFAKANNGQFPTDLAQLKPYFPSSIEDAILDRWEVAPANTVHTDNFGGDQIITEKSAVDPDWDPRYAVGLKGFASAGRDTEGRNGWGVIPPDRILGPVFKAAADAYLAANNGVRPTDPSQLLPYLNLTTPEQQAAYQKFTAWHQPRP